MKTLLTILIGLLAASHAWAGSSLSTVTISQSLTLTSPSAIISMTGISATASLTTVYAKNTSFTTAYSVSQTVGTISGTGAYAASVIFNGAGSPTVIIRQYNVSGVLKNNTGNYAIVGTFPNNPLINCTANLTGGATGAVATVSSPTTTSISIITYNTATGAPENKNYIGCTVY